MSWILGSRRSPEGENDNPLQYSCLGNPMDRRGWWATVHRGTKSQTQLSTWHTQDIVSDGVLDLSLYKFYLSPWNSESTMKTSLGKRKDQVKETSKSSQLSSCWTSQVPTKLPVDLRKISLAKSIKTGSINIHSTNPVFMTRWKAINSCYFKPLILYYDSIVVIGDIQQVCNLLYKPGVLRMKGTAINNYTEKAGIN